MTIAEMIFYLDRMWKTNINKPSEHDTFLLPQITHDRAVNLWQIDGEKNFSDSELGVALEKAVKWTREKYE